MKIKDLRQHIIDNRDEIKRLSLTDNQIEIIKLISENTCVSSSSLSKLHSISVQNASTKLKKLYDMGYIDRDPYECPTGGHEYLYFTRYQ